MYEGLESTNISCTKKVDDLLGHFMEFKFKDCIRKIWPDDKVHRASWRVRSKKEGKGRLGIGVLVLMRRSLSNYKRYLKTGIFR